MELAGKVAIVTGASRGIGRQIAIEFARRGMPVVVAARTVEARRRLPGTIGETLATIVDAGGKAIVVPADVTKVEDLERLVASAVDTYGRLDVLVNNAANTQANTATIDEYDRATWLAQFDANVHGPFTLMSLAVPHMRAHGGGVIVNISSGAGDLVPVDVGAVRRTDGPIRLPTLLGYTTTKAALNRLTNALAPDLVADNIAVVAVDPGYTRTELVDILSEQGLVDAEAAGPMLTTVHTVLQILTADDPLTFTGQIRRAQPDQQL